MSNVPANHVVAEGRTLRAAVESAAVQLGVPASQVGHKIDVSHFRNAQGGGVGVDTVKIFAWATEAVDLAPAQAAEEWMRGLLASMERTGTVRAEIRGSSVVVFVDVGEAGRHLVGRGGSTLGAIHHLMEGAIRDRFPNFAFRIDVARAEGEERPDGDRGRPERRGDRGDRGGDRGDRGGDRGDRGGDRGDRGGDRRERRRDDDRPRRSDSDSEELRRLTRKLADKVRRSGEPEQIRRELNSYDRRIVHMEVAAIDGVASRSVGEGHDRRVEIYVAEAGSSGNSDAE